MGQTVGVLLLLVLGPRLVSYCLRCIMSNTDVRLACF